MTPEQIAREHIDRQLNACGWVVQERKSMNISGGTGVAVKEFPLKAAERVSESRGTIIGGQKFTPSV